MKKSKSLIIGVVMAAVGGVIILLEQITDWGVSTFIGKLYCGDRYLQAAGQAGDGMCGFNIDMVVGMGSFLLILTGILLIVIGVITLLIRKRKSKQTP